MQCSIPLHFSKFVLGVALKRYSNSNLLIASLLAASAIRTADGQAFPTTTPQTTRAQIEATIAASEQILASPGYSGRIKDARRREIVMLKNRLEEGDLQPGDQVVIAVQGEKDLSGAFDVLPGRVLVLPGVGEIPVHGVLRSEIQEHLTVQLRKQLRDPVVHAQTTMQISILGAVPKPGFYPASADMKLTDAIMLLGGGPSPGIDPAKSRVERKGVELVSKEAFAQALQEGRTLDQMSLRAGDEILIGGQRYLKPVGMFGGTVLPVLTTILGLSFLVVQIF
jgi:protein involved in polysaccharide export with SLBB domain